MSGICLHCELKTKPGEQFCCRGCKAAYGLINNLGLGNYYRNRILKTGGKSLKPEENSTENRAIDVSGFVMRSENNLNSLYLMVEGMHCAACVWLIENILKKQPEVKTARINMSSRRLHLQWSSNAKYGNKLVKLITDLGYKLIPFDIEIVRAQEKKYDNSLLKAMAVAGFAAGNLMLISIALWTSSSESMGIVTRNLLYWVSALIALPTMVYSGRIFIISAYKALRSGRTNMDVPISMAIILVAVASIIEAFHYAEHIYFDSAVMLIFFLLIGRYLDFNVRRKAMSVASDLIMLSASSATILENNQRKIIPAKEILKGMILLIAPGEKIAADGVIINGNSEIDTSLITGESLPKKVGIGSEIFAGMVNLSGAIKVQVNKTKDETLLSKIVHLVENLDQSRSHYVRIADRVAKYYTPLVHILALISFLLGIYFFKYGWKISLINAIAVLIVTCPCALALAVPVVQIVSGSRLMKKGILVKSGETLEKLNDIKTIVFDKTGTLTIGKMALSSAYLYDQNQKIKIDSKSPYFQIAASVASNSNHPLSKALSAIYKGQKLDLNVKEIPGHGLISSYKNQEIKLGKRVFVIGENSWLTEEKSSPEIYLSYDNKIIIFTFEDALKQDAKAVIDQLKKLDKKIILLSGDKEKVVETVAKRLGISEYYFEKTPIEKCDLLKEFKSKYQNIVMVGDGLNDAPSLVLADVSISPASAADITKNAADIIFQGDKLSPVLETILTATKSRILIKQNFALALIYNLVAVPFAMAGYIVPVLAALAMSSSSIIVVLNALRVKSGR